MNVIDVSPVQLAYCLVFILIAGVGSVTLKLELERDLIVGTIRTFAQLAILGYVLKFIFDLDNAWLILLLFSFMVFWATSCDMVPMIPVPSPSETIFFSPIAPVTV